MKIVVNNIKKTKHEDFSDYLKRKWEARDSSSSSEQGFPAIRKKSRPTILDSGAKNESDRQVHKFSKP